MASRLEIRDVPDDVRSALEAPAAARGESLNSHLLESIRRDVARATAPEVLDRAARRVGRAQEPAVETLAEERAERKGQLTPRPA